MAELYVIGRILGGTEFEVNTGHFCKWTIQTGTLWKKISGITDGRTQVDTPSEVGQPHWSHPIDILFVANGLEGWPKLIVQVCRQDKYGRSDLSGYGVCHIPTTPGTHIVHVPTWRPAGSDREELERYFVGGSTELSQLDITSSSNERFRLRTKPSGTVIVEFGIILRNFEKYGIET